MEQNERRMVVALSNLLKYLELKTEYEIGMPVLW